MADQLPEGVAEDEVKINFPGDSLGDVLGEQGGGALVGAYASHGGLTARLSKSTILPLWDDFHGDRLLRRMRVTLTLEVTHDGQKKELESFAEFGLDDFYDAFLMPLPADAQATATAALQKLVALGDEGALQDLLRPLLDDLMPTPAAGSFISWLETDAVEALQGKDGLLAQGSSDEVILTAKVKALHVERSFRTFGTVKLQVEVTASDAASGQLMAKLEQELYSGGLSVDAAKLGPPDLTKPEFQELLGRWKAYLSESLVHVYEQGGVDALVPGDIFPDTSLPSLLEEWVAHGPPGPAPEPLLVQEAVRTRTAHTLRPCTEAEIDSLQEFLEPELSAAYFVEGYQIGICQGDTGDDWVILREKTSEPFLMMRSDEEPSSRLKYTIDGDGWTARAVLEWLGDALRRSENDFFLPLHPAEQGKEEPVDADDEGLEEGEEVSLQKGTESESLAALATLAPAHVVPEARPSASTGPKPAPEKTVDDDADDAVTQPELPTAPGTAPTPAADPDDAVTDARAAAGDADDADDAAGDEDGDDGDDDDSVDFDDEDQVPLSEWLRFRGPYHADEPMFDWRHPNDLIVDGAPYWDSRDLFMPPAPPDEVGRIRAKELPAYYRFIRRVLDPDFVGALEPRN